MIQQFSKLSLNTQDILFSQISDSQLPSSIINTADIRKIDSIFLNNFKSFGKKYVGPFLNFTSIIGPNGSGKSNILDAVMFCLCSENSRHSLLDPRQLINRQGKQTFKQLMKENKICSVSICFILADDSKFSIERILDPEGKQQYRINHEIVPKKVYENVLLRKGINCNTPNYAIWQGQIDRLVLKTPIQLTNLFENLSGSIYYKKVYEQIKQRLTILQQKYEQKVKLINKLKIDKKNVKNLKKNNEHLEKLESTYSEIMNKFYLLKVLEKETGIQRQERQVEKARKEEDAKIRQINQRKAVFQKSHHEKQLLLKQLGSIKQQLTKLQELLQKIDNPTNVLYLQDLNLQINEAQNIENQIKDLSQRKQQLLQNIPQIPSSSLIEEYLQVYEKWEQENSALNREFIRRNNQLLFVEGMLQNKKQSFSDYENRAKNFSKKREQNKDLLRNYEQNLKQVKNSINLIEKQKEKAHNNSKKFQKELFEKQEELQKLMKNIQDLENLIAEESSSKKQAELLKHLSGISHFYGVLEDKIQPISHKYQVVFQTLFSNISQQLIVQNQRSSREVGNRLRQMNIMKTVLILDNVITNTNSGDKNKQHESNEIRKKIGRDGQLAIDCIEHDERLVGLKEYISHFLFGKIVCENIQTAYKIRNKKIEGIKQIYTIDGNVVKSDGTISTHGNPEALKKAYRYHSNKSNIFQDLSKLNKEKDKLQASIKQTKNKTGITDRFTSEITQLEIKKSQITEKIKELQKTQVAKQQKPPQSLLIEIKQLEHKKQKISKELSELDRMMKSSKLFQGFMRKNNIEDLSVFRNANNFEQIQKMMKKKSEINREIAEIVSEISELENKYKKKQKKIEKIKLNIDALPDKRDQKQIEKQIAEKQEQEQEIKNKISKLAVLTTKESLHFQSILPTLQARLQYAKQKIMKELEQTAQELGVKFQYPFETDELRKQLNLSKKRKLGQDDFEQIYADLSAQREKIEVNMNKYNTLALMKHKADDEQDFEDRIERLTDELDEIRENRSKQSEQLEKIRKDRAMVLLNFIEKLKYNLENSYRILTELQNGLIGNIDLHIENTEFPFEYGTYYSPTPPTKRFVYDLEQLSGGEKSVASLALQYSLALATGVPFLILDQTDAYLDASNVQRFLKLISHSLENKNIQMIVISHKQSLFSQSQSLIGVSRPKSNPLSQIFSLKLVNYS